MIHNQVDYSLLYNEIIREIRNRRVKEELFQMKLKGIEEEQLPISPLATNIDYIPWYIQNWDV